MFQHEEQPQPKKSVAFQVDDQKVEELEDAKEDLVNIATTQKETTQSETQIALEQKETTSSDEISSSVKGKLKKRITKQVNRACASKVVISWAYPNQKYFSKLEKPEPEKF